MTGLTVEFAISRETLLPGAALYCSSEDPRRISWPALESTQFALRTGWVEPHFTGSASTPKRQCN